MTENLLLEKTSLSDVIESVEKLLGFEEEFLEEEGTTLLFLEQFCEKWNFAYYLDMEVEGFMQTSFDETALEEFCLFLNEQEYGLAHYLPYLGRNEALKQQHIEFLINLDCFKEHIGSKNVREFYKLIAPRVSEQFIITYKNRFINEPYYYLLDDFLEARQFSEDFLLLNLRHLAIEKICRTQNLKEEFIRSHMGRLNFHWCSLAQNESIILSGEFLVKYKYDIDCYHEKFMERCPDLTPEQEAILKDYISQKKTHEKLKEAEIQINSAIRKLIKATQEK